MKLRKSCWGEEAIRWTEEENDDVVFNFLKILEESKLEESSTRVKCDRKHSPRSMYPDSALFSACNSRLICRHFSRKWCLLWNPRLANLNSFKLELRMNNARTVGQIWNYPLLIYTDLQWNIIDNAYHLNDIIAVSTDALFINKLTYMELPIIVNYY